MAKDFSNEVWYLTDFVPAEHYNPYVVSYLEWLADFAMESRAYDDQKTVKKHTIKHEWMFSEHDNGWRMRSSGIMTALPADEAA
jgi:hypothetical protein